MSSLRPSAARHNVRPHRSSLICAIYAATMLSLVVAGCHRGYYRREADAEAQMLIEQKAQDPRWNQVDSNIEIDPRSRMFDPFSADHPPLPPDDPASHKLMEFTDCKPNYPHWHANGDTQFVENPEWVYFVPLNEKGELVLNLDNAVRLALLHSSDYQTQREQLYLSALDVSLQRFGFDAQLFAGVNGFFRTNGPDRGGASLANLEGGRARLQKLGITGSTLAIGIANTIMWNFAGNNTQSATSLIDFSLVQPLLRGAGRDRIMESLTSSERQLLADIRQMERFRRGFYLNVVTGRNPGQGVGGNALGNPGGGLQGAGGFLGLLADLQSIRILERNVQEQQEVLEQFQAFFREERIDLLQVTQVESNLYSAQRQLAQARTRYQDSLDVFKATLGLPPDLPVVIEDNYLVQFELISDEVNLRQDEIKLVSDKVGLVLVRMNNTVQVNKFDTDPLLDGDQFGLNWDQTYENYLDELIPILNELEPIRKKVLDEVVEQVKQDFARLNSVRGERVQSLQSLQEIVRENPESYDIETAILDENEVATAEQLEAQLQETLDKIDQLAKDIDQTIETIQALIDEGDSLSPREFYDKLENEVARAVPEHFTNLANYVLEISLVQARSRTDSIMLPEVDISWERAIAIARCFRRDWMNARAALVDQYRQIEFVADDLESQLDLVFEGDVGNDGNNPFKIRYQNSSLGVGLRFDAPITRVSERNRYRQALIQYQRTRRNYYIFKDAIKRALRQEIRNIELNKILFELDRRAIRIAVQEVELARLALEEPPQIRRALDSVGSSFGQQTARNLTNALNSLQRTQNTFLNTWVGFEAQRRSLDFDLGTMQLTPDGFWIDPGEIDESIAIRASESMGIPCQPVSSEIDPYAVDYDNYDFVTEESDSQDSSLDSEDGEALELDEEMDELNGDSSNEEPTLIPEILNEQRGGLLDPQPDAEITPPRNNDGAQIRQPVRGRSAIRKLPNLR